MFKLLIFNAKIVVKLNGLNAMQQIAGGQQSQIQPEDFTRKQGFQT